MLGDEAAASLLIAFALCDAWCTNGLVSSAVLLKDVISVAMNLTLFILVVFSDYAGIPRKSIDLMSAFKHPYNFNL